MLTWNTMFEITGADGVDCFSMDYKTIINSYSKKQLVNTGCPGWGYFKFYKKVNGTKYYIDFKEVEAEKPTHTVNIEADVQYVMGTLNYGYYHGTLHLTESQYQEFTRDPREYIYNHELISTLDFKVTDYDIDDIGEVSEVVWKDE